MKKRQMNRYLTVGLILTVLVAGLIVLGLFWTPYDPSAMAVGGKFEAPLCAI